MKYDVTRLLVVCDCHHPEHQLIISSDSHGDLYFGVYLAKLPLFKRIWYGLRYIAGYQSRYGAFDEIMVNKSADAIIQALQDWKQKPV